MTTSVPLRRSLRKIPAFRSLPRQDLAEITDQLACKEYKPGDVLWRTSSQPDFLGIIQSGEIIVEHRINGSVIRSTRLGAGDFVKPRNLENKNGHSVVLARAVTDVRFYVLRMQQIDTLNPHSTGAGIRQHARLHRDRNGSWRSLWITIIIISILLLTWSDLTRIISGTLYLASYRLQQSVSDDPRSMRLLEYAKSLDHKAVFAQNQEGYIRFHDNNVQEAEEAFMKAVDIDPNNSPALNNLAVTYFTSGQSQQAVVLQEKAVQNDPDNAIVRYNLGLALMKQNYGVKALREFKEASYIDPTWALPRLEQGFIYLQRQDYMGAEQAAKEAIKLDPSQQSAHVVLAIALLNQNKNQEALTSIEDALQIDPEDRISQFYKAQILSNLGESKTALLTFRKLLESSTDPQEISRITQEIEALYRSQQDVPVGVH